MTSHCRKLALTALLLSGCQAGGQALHAPAPPLAQAGYQLLGLPTTNHLLGVAFTVAAAAPPAPEAASDPAGGANLVVWQDGNALRAQLLDAFGVPLRSSTLLTDPAHVATDPRVVYNSELDEYLVVYSEDTGGTSGVDLFAQRVSNAGFAIGASLPVSQSLGQQRHPAAAYDALQHEYFVVWDDDRSGAPAIYARRLLVDADKSLSLSAEILVASVPLGHELSHPDVAFGARGQVALVCWQDGRRNQLDILAQRLGPDGAAKGPNYVVCALDQDQRLPRIAYNADRDRFFVVFEDDSNGQADTDILGRQLNGWGYPAAGNVIVSNQFGPQKRPHIAYNTTAKSFLVTYDEDLGAGDHITARYLDGTASPADTVAVTTAGVASDACVVANNAEFATFYPARGAGGSGLLGQRLDAGF